MGIKLIFFLKLENSSAISFIRLRPFRAQALFQNALLILDQNEKGDKGITLIFFEFERIEM